MTPPPIRPLALGVDRHVFEHRPNGAITIRCPDPLGPFEARTTDPLVRFAAGAPDQVFVAKRDNGGTWHGLTYAETLRRVEAVAAALLGRGLSAERPLVILSGNDRDHAVLALAALHVGIPYAPVSPAYATVGGGYARLKDVLRLLTPGLVFAADAATFGPAIAAAVPPDVEIVLGSGALPGRAATPLAELMAGTDPDAVARAHAAVTPDTMAKFLFTSGSTGLPKAVITTHRMLCANQAQIAARFPDFARTPPVLVDWLPWHHVFGGNHNFNIVLFNGGSLYIDDGRPTPALIGETVRNLKEIAPTCYLTVPKGYEALIPHLRADPELRRSFFSRLNLTFFAAAGLPQPVWDALDAVAVAECGERIAMLTGLGATETAPFALCCRPDQTKSGYVGLPARGVELKLAPVADKLEARVKGPNVTPGYWRNPAMTAAAYDQEGYYRLGDALQFVDPDDLDKGLYFDGRLNEDFKLTSGVWVSVGPLRARVLNAAAPYARDVAIAGENRADIRALFVPDLAECRALCPDLAPDADAGAVLEHPAVRQRFEQILADLAAASTGGSNRITHAILLEEPPSMDLNEITDKGSINQRTTLKNRAVLVEELYRDAPSPRVIVAARVGA